MIRKHRKAKKQFHIHIPLLSFIQSLLPHPPALYHHRSGQYLSHVLSEERNRTVPQESNPKR